MKGAKFFHCRSAEGGGLGTEGVEVEVVVIIVSPVEAGSGAVVVDGRRHCCGV